MLNFQKDNHFLSILFSWRDPTRECGKAVLAEHKTDKVGRENEQNMQKTTSKREREETQRSQK